MKPDVQIYSPAEFDVAGAQKILGCIRRTLQRAEECHLVLTGGSTPRGIYSQLASAENRESVEWQRLHLYWGDERMVPPEHEDSNFRMVKETLLDHVPIPEENIHRMRGEIDPDASAREYTERLREHFAGPFPTLDLILLGTGEDGHTASLFPGTSAVTEKQEWVTPVFVPKLETWRVTLTLPVITRAREILFLVSGASKAEIVKQILTLTHPTGELPASLVQPDAGTLTWILDEEAAALLNM